MFACVFVKSKSIYNSLYPVLLSVFININSILTAILWHGIINTSILHMRKQRQGEVKKID